MSNRGALDKNVDLKAENILKFVVFFLEVSQFFLYFFAKFQNINKGVWRYFIGRALKMVLSNL